MSLLEWEGTVVPSMMSQPGDEVSGFFAGYMAPTIMVGRIVKVYKPTDNLSFSKSFYEYDVAVERMSGSGIVTRSTVPHCKVMNLFGGVADSENWTHRDEGETSFSEEPGYGPQVLVACPGGSTREGVIIGGIPHTRNATVQADEGHNWRRKFNGTEMSVNKDGEFTISFRGAVDAKDALASGVNAANSGSKIVLLKDGSVKVSTNGDQQFIHVDHANKKLDIKADSSWTVTVAGPWEVSTLGATTHESQGIGTAYTVNAPAGMIHLNSAIGTTLGGGVNQMLMGTNYRVAEIALNSARLAGFTAMAAQFAAVGVSLSTAGGVLQAVSVLHKIPVAGAVLGSVPLQAAAAAVMAAGATLASLAATVSSTLVAPLTTFEAGAPSYLSLKNLLD